MSAAGFVEARGDLAQGLVPHAAGLAIAVREETRPEIRARLTRLSRTELEGLAVVLAAMVDPDRSMREALGWVDFDEYGRPLEPARKPRSDRPDPGARSIREVGQPGARSDRNFPLGVDMVLVERAVAGHRVELNKKERTEAIELGIRRGLGYDGVAKQLGMTREAVSRSWSRIKERARAEGRPVPAEPVNMISAVA